MSYSIIAAVGQKNELGKQGGLCFNIPGDLKYFKKVTKGHTVVMGANTFFSLPKMLPGRKHLVLCNDGQKFPEEVTVFNSLEDLFKEYPLDSKEEIFVIGGGRIYAEFIKYADKMYLTEVNATDDDADTFFASFNKDLYTREVVGKGEDNDLTYDFVVYTKK